MDLFRDVSFVAWFSLCPSCLAEAGYKFGHLTHSRFNANNPGLSKKCHFSVTDRVSSATFQPQVRMFALVG